MKNFYRSLLVGMGLLLLVVMTLPAAEPAELPDNPTVTHLQKVAVTVRTLRGTGSGWVVLKDGHAFVLTAGHVVEGNRLVNRDPGDQSSRPKVTFEDLRIVQQKIKNGRHTGTIDEFAEVLRYSPIESGDDLALLLLRDPDAFKEGIKFYQGKKLPPLGTKIWHVGSLLGEFGSNSTVHGSIAQHGRLIDGKVYDQLDCNAFPGSSGGAVTLEDGRAIGMIVRGATGGFSLMVPLRRMVEWGKRQKCEWIFNDAMKVPSLEEIKKHPIEDGEPQKKEGADK